MFQLQSHIQSVYCVFKNGYTVMAALPFHLMRSESSHVLKEARIPQKNTGKHA
jgi:hypothetical protein